MNRETHYAAANKRSRWQPVVPRGGGKRWHPKRFVSNSPALHANYNGAPVGDYNAGCMSGVEDGLPGQQLLT